LDGAAEELGIAAYTSGMGPILGYWIAQGVLPASPDVAAVLELHYRHNSSRMEKMAERSIAAVKALADAGIRVTVLKGMQTAFAAFPVQGTRPLSDIDLLIDPADKRPAEDVLRSLGYTPGRTVPLPPQQCWRMHGTPKLPRSLSLVHHDDPWYIDLQTSLDRRYSAGAPMISLDGALGPRTSDSWALSPAGKSMSPALLALHVAWHASCGLQNLRLVRLTELALTIGGNQRNAAFPWEEFIDIGEQTRVLSSAYPALYLTELLAPGTVCNSVLRRSESRAPRAVRRVVKRLTPANGQRILRCSLEERFMWTSSFSNFARQLALDIVPRKIPFREVLSIYQMRLWRILRGKFSRRARTGY
jgi:hypothetical protein